MVQKLEYWVEKSLENHPDNLEEKILHMLEAQAASVKAYFSEKLSLATNT